MRLVAYIHAFDDNNILRIRFELDRGRVLSFVVQLECYFEDNGWLPVFRYDTAHGIAHRDKIVSAPKCWDNRWVWAAVELPPHRFGALTK